METYYYCDGFDLKTVTVTANFGTCANFREYTDEYCTYRTWSRTIIFTLSKQIPVDLSVRYKYYHKSYQDNVLTYEGWITSSVIIPAGETHYTFNEDCKEERYCNSGESATE